MKITSFIAASALALATTAATAGDVSDAGVSDDDIVVILPTEPAGSSAGSAGSIGSLGALGGAGPALGIGLGIATLALIAANAGSGS